MTLDVHFGRAAQTVSVTRTKAGPRRDIMRGGDLRAELRGGRAVSRPRRRGGATQERGRSLPGGRSHVVMILGRQDPEVALLRRCIFDLIQV